MSEKFLSCNGLGLSPLQILAGWLRPQSGLPDGFGFSEKNLTFTYQGRYAVNLICQILHIGPGDEVLLPAYNCGAEVDPFVCAGAKVIFYRIDARAAIDTEDITRRITPSTKVIYISHFWGWPQEIRELAKFCKARSIFLVEDCALCLFSKGPENTIGQIGDAAIYSFVKSLPVPDGGALILKNKGKWAVPITNKPPRFKNIVLNLLPLLKKWFMNDNKFWQRHKFTRGLLHKSWLKVSTNQNMDIEREMPKGNYFDAEKIGWTTSKPSKGIICETEPRKILDARRRNYRHLQQALSGIPNIKLLFDDLPEGVCPLSFPFFVKDRNHWANKLEDKGILVGGWPSYHRKFNWEEYPEARHLKNDLVTLPVHQNLDLHQMVYISDCVKLIAESDDHNNSRRLR